MGNDQTTLRQKVLNIPNLNKYVALSAKHNQKVFRKKVKSFQQFSFVIKSILLRSSYLKYQWAEWLCKQLKKDNKKLYQYYCEMFKINLLINQKSKSYFQLKNFQQFFFQSFIKNQKYDQQQQITQKRLQKIFQEAKCYIMVESWFQELPLNIKKQKQTKQSQSKQNNSNLSLHSIEKSEKKYSKQKKIIQKNVSYIERRMYQILLKVTEVYFQHTYKDKLLKLSLSNYSPQKYKKGFNSNQMQLIKFISKQNKYKNRELLIYELIISMTNEKKLLNMNQQQKTAYLSEKIKLLIKILGLKNVYCMLKLLKEIGNKENQKLNLIFSILENIIDPINEGEKL